MMASLDKNTFNSAKADNHSAIQSTQKGRNHGKPT
jgi:hypothetical protein